VLKLISGGYTRPLFYVLEKVEFVVDRTSFPRPLLVIKSTHTHTHISCIKRMASSHLLSNSNEY
jgi:hypothetical protein